MITYDNFANNNGDFQAYLLRIETINRVIDDRFLQTDTEFDELANILEDDSKKRNLEEYYKSNGYPQSKTQRDELFGRAEQNEVGTGG
jgi:hypothetical protein